MQEVFDQLIERTMRRLARVPKSQVGPCLMRWAHRQPDVFSYLLAFDDTLPDHLDCALIRIFWVIAESMQALGELPPVSVEVLAQAHAANDALSDLEPSEEECFARFERHFASYPQMSLFNFAKALLEGASLDNDQFGTGLLAIKTAIDCLHQVSDSAVNR